MYNHNKAQQSKNRVHISWDILYLNGSKRPISLREYRIFVASIRRVLHLQRVFIHDAFSLNSHITEVMHIPPYIISARRTITAHCYL